MLEFIFNIWNGDMIVFIICDVEDVHPWITPDDVGWDRWRDNDGQWFSRGRRRKTPGA